MITLIAASLPGLAALGALLFTWMQVGQASRELRISEHGQITSRFNSAINNLGSDSMDVRLGGIYALERIMQDSARDHPTVVSVLAAFAQRHARPSAESLKEPVDPEAMPTPEADVRAAIATLAHRRPNRDRGTLIDLSHTDLRGLLLAARAPIKLPEVNLSETDLRLAYLVGADLHKAYLYNANLEGADLETANLRDATLTGARLSDAFLSDADLRGAEMNCAEEELNKAGTGIERSKCVDLQYADLSSADLRTATLSDARLDGASLVGADLRGANLLRANLSNADLTYADLRGATLYDTKLEGAELSGARGLPPKS
ncbi:pentapeptide repeat-containing protein [Streptomyces luteogriseus]|uniref:pentapeptide repeat-containing protein n=1 Tax=Streptomyces luteogriseus TaxID=68233 RepID=UPI0037A09FED